jgi:hypothetical protein
MDDQGSSCAGALLGGTGAEHRLRLRDRGCGLACASAAASITALHYPSAPRLADPPAVAGRTPCATFAPTKAHAERVVVHEELASSSGADAVPGTSREVSDWLW